MCCIQALSVVLVGPTNVYNSSERKREHSSQKCQGRYKQIWNVMSIVIMLCAQRQNISMLYHIHRFHFPCNSTSVLTTKVFRGKRNWRNNDIWNWNLKVYPNPVLLLCNQELIPTAINIHMYTGNFSLHHRVQTGSGANPASYTTGTRGSFSGG